MKQTTGIENQNASATFTKKISFPLGNVFVTNGAWESLDFVTVLDSLNRHHRGDWGNVPDEDAEANCESLVYGGRLFSVYGEEKGKRFWIITEADRQSTTILLPEEY
jgi:hypothetical protein